VLIPRCDVAEKPLKKTHHRSGGPGIRTQDLPNAKRRARRLATMLGIKQLHHTTTYRWHVEGIDEGRVAKMLMTYGMDRKRTKGTSRTRWKAEGEEDLRMTGIISWKTKERKIGRSGKCNPTSNGPARLVDLYYKKHGFRARRACEECYKMPYK
jgi:hypothetical protein